MNEQIKSALHELIDNCDNVILLEEAKSLLESSQVKDWWEDLSEDDKNIVLESETEYTKGAYVSHNDLMKDFDKWKKKQSGL